MPRYPITSAEQRRRLQAFAQQHLPSPLQPLELAPLADPAAKAGLTISIKRDDLIHPRVSGNKWRKLSGNAQALIDQSIRTVISFGGAYSNHLVALATLTDLLGLSLVAVIRGEAPPRDRWNPRLAYLAERGVELHFISRQTYRARYDLDYQAAWEARYPQAVVIPEGGSNTYAISGIGEMVQEVRQQLAKQRKPAITHWLCPIGSGGTAAGILTHCEPNEHVIAISVLKGASDLAKRVANLCGQSHQHGGSAPVEHSRLTIWHDYHAGGFARSTLALLSLVDAINQAGLPVEPVYTGKMFYALRQKIAMEYFAPGSHLMIVHTGGVWT